MVSGDPSQGPIREVAITADGGGLAASIIELGSAVRDLVVKTADGRMQRVVLGLASVDDYFTYSPHMGAICGRFANRIRHGRFTLDGRSYQLPLNQDGRHTLHGGGPTGFGKSRWTLLHADANSATLAIHSPAGHNGFPGAVPATCRYSLVDPATLRIELWAVSDAPTIINLCHHSYFNLDGSPDILDNILEMRADYFTPTDADLAGRRVERCRAVGLPAGQACASGTGRQACLVRPTSSFAAIGASPRRDGLDLALIQQPGFTEVRHRNGAMDHRARLPAL
jgi:galactose mutarotase-like enzyme